MLELFANPGYLAAGAALITAPIIIHLINRMRFKRLRWAAMEFLLKSQKRNRRRLIIEQILLLFLRCLLVTLATLLVSRFIGDLYGDNQSAATLHIVVLDDTLSMRDQFKDGDAIRDCFQAAKSDLIFERIVKPVGQTNRNERLILLTLTRLVTDRDYQPKAYARLNDKAKLDELKSDLEDLQPSKVHADLLIGVKKAQELAAQNIESHVILYVISDFRQSDWLAGGKNFQEALLGLVKTSDIEIKLMDAAHPPRTLDQGGFPLSHDNVGIVDFRAGTRVVGKGMPVTFTVTIANYSAREADVTLTIFNDNTGQEMLQADFLDRTMPLKIPAGKTDEKVSFEVRLDPPLKEGHFAHISARLESAHRGKLENDGLVEDNIRHAAVEVRDKVPVLVVDGEGARGRNENNDSFFIRNAIISVPGGSFDVVFADELAGGVAGKALERADLMRYPTIFLLNVRELTPKQLTNLENYVRDGGGVAFFLGPLVDPAYYNKNLYKKGQGLFPCPLRETYFPPPNEEPRKGEFTGFEHLLLRYKQKSDLDKLPVFGPIFREEDKFFSLLKDLPIKRYYQVPRSEWHLPAGRVQELATLPNEQSVLAYQATTLELLNRLEKIAKADDYQAYRRGLGRHRRDIEALIGPGSEKRAQHLASALEVMLHDKGKEKERAEYPNLIEFWANSDPKVRTLHSDIMSLIEETRYGDPFVVLGKFGKGKVVAVMSTAGKAWNSWGGGCDASLIYQPFIWEMQNYLSSQGSESDLAVGTPVRIFVDPEQFKQKNRLLKMVRYYQSAQTGKPIPPKLDGELFGELKQGLLMFSFDRSLEPGLYVSELVYQDQSPGKPPLAKWNHVFNVDTKQEGNLQRIGKEDLESHLLEEGGGRIKFETLQPTGNDVVARQSDLSEWPWFFLIFLAVLVAEQALAVHLSFHLRGGEASLPSVASRAA
jgi:hypothetical protein